MTKQASIEAKSSWDSIGPFYSAGDVAILMETSLDSVADMSDNDLVRVVTDDEKWLYPRFQFERTVLEGVTYLLPLPHASEITRVLREGTMSDRVIAEWLSAKEHSSDTRTRAERLRTGDFENVLGDAQHTVAKWKQAGKQK